MVEREKEWRESCYFVSLQHIRKMLDTLITDVILSKVKCSEYLQKTVS